MKQPKDIRPLTVKTVKELQTELKRRSSSWSINPKFVKEQDLENLSSQYSLGARIVKLDEVKGQPFHRTASPGVLRSNKPLPPSWDWRNVNGRNFVTAVKDQMSCGACTAFACAATIESNMLIQDDKDISQILPGTYDLSESSLFFTAGRSCKLGWDLLGTLTYAVNQGICYESSYPFSPNDQQSYIIPSGMGGTNTVKLNAFSSTSDIQTMKNWLVNKGPLIADFEVYHDFFYFFHYSEEEVYRYAIGGLAGGHATSVIGYDDNREAWLCKNSWGASDAHPDGCFWIGYGECGLDELMYIPEGITKVNNSDKISYDPNNLRIEKQPDGTYLLFEGNHALRFFANEEDAKNGLAVAKRHNRVRWVGRGISHSNPKRKDYLFEYWTGDSGLPHTPLTNIDIIPYNPNNTFIKYNKDRGDWSVCERLGNGEILGMFIAFDMDDALAILNVVQNNNRLGYIGRDNHRSNRKDYIMRYFEYKK